MFRAGLFRSIFNSPMFRYAFLPGTAIVLFIAYLGFIGWSSLAPRKPVADSIRQKAGKEAVRKIVEDIRENRGEISRVVLLHFGNDPTDFITNTLRGALDQSGVLNLEDSYFSEKFRNMLNLRNVGVSTAAEALKKVKGEENIQGVLWGQIERFESVNGSVFLSGSWQLLDARTGEVICEGKIYEDSIVSDEDTKKASKKAAAANTSGDDAREERTEIDPSDPVTWAPWYIRIPVFMLLVLLIPVLTITFIRTMVAKRSNKINAFILGVYTLIDAIWAFLMVGAAFSNGWVVFGFSIAVLAALAYNYILMSFALKLES